MKKLIILLSFLLSLTSMANESMSDIGKQKLLSQKISQAIVNLESMKDKVSLNQLLLKTEQSKNKKIAVLIEQGATIEQISVVEQKLNEEIQMYKDIADVDTILDLQIAKLQEAQTSANFMFLATRVNVVYLLEGTAATVLFSMFLTPFAVALDIVTLPLTFLSSAVTGF